MTNHAPTFTSSNATGSFSENSNTTGSSAAHALSGTMNFTDSDHSDTHTTSVTLKTVSWPGGTIPTASRNDLNAAMTSSILSDSNGSGKIKWNFSAPDKDFDFLAKNETLVLTYEVKVSDNHGGSTTHTVTITITGTDDKPVITMGASAILTEQANHTLSLSLDTAHIALNFTDADLDNTGHTATVIGASASGSTGGILPGSLGTAELMSFFRVDNVVKNSGSGSGTINTTFSALDLAFDYLAAGEHVTITYVVQLDDHAGGVSTQNVTVTVNGTNDKPEYICGPETAHLVEGQNLSPSGDLTAHGDLLFGDIDLSDTHTVSTTATATRSGGGAVPLTNAQLLAAMHTTLDDSNGTLLGDVAWNFAMDNDSVNFLQAGETLTITYSLTIKDPSNATDTETVTITILGTNHPVMITSGPESASLSETADTTGSPAPDTTSPVPTGTLTFTDQDLSDTHTVQVTVASTSWSGGSGVPAATLAALPAALQTTLNDSTGSGTGGVDWTFSIADNNLDFLSDGETLTVDYNVKVSDGSTSSTQTVSILVTGTNDAPLVTSGPESSSIAERPNTVGSSQLDSTSPVPTGTLNFNDVDLSDMHSVNVSIASAVWSGDPDYVLPFDVQSDMIAGLATTLHDSTGSGAGSVDWSFSIPDRDLDFLADGETLTVTFNVAVADGFTSSSQTVTITMTGATDPLVVSPITSAVSDTVFADVSQILASGNLISESVAGGDFSSFAISDVNGSAGNLDTEVAGTYGSLFVDGSGFYRYTAFASTDALQAGDNVTDVFTFTVVDNHGHSEPTTVTFQVAGADDAPVITSAVAAGSMTEDLGPSTIVNGGFETGDLTGWVATNPAIEVQFTGLGGEFENYSARLGATASFQELYQYVPTNPGQHYLVSFYVSGDSDSSSNSLSVTWDSTTVLALADNYSSGLTRYSFDVVSNGTQPNTLLQFTYSDDGTGLFVDQVKVEGATGPATESADGSVSFSDAETGDTHTASFVPQSGGYVGTFSLDPVSESAGSGSVGWHFTVNNADIQFLGQNDTLTQTYSVLVTDDHGASVAQDVTITMNGTNDAPTAVSETVVTDVGAGGTVDIPVWALAANDTDPDRTDSPTPDAIVSSSGGTAVPFGDAFFIDDATPGGSFDYTVTDGHATSSNAATATIVNNPTSSIALVGTGGDDIIIGNQSAGETLNGGGGNDVLVGYGGLYVMTGGSGNDIFGFQSTADTPSVVTDFNVIGQDKVAISASGFGGPLSAGMDTSSIFESSADDQFSGAAVFHYDESNQTLYYSADATGSSAIAVVQLQAGALMHANDLLIV